jgi:hypothetical protein
VVVGAAAAAVVAAAVVAAAAALWAQASDGARGGATATTYLTSLEALKRATDGRLPTSCTIGAL